MHGQTGARSPRSSVNARSYG